MKKKKTIFDFGGQVFFLFGIMVAILIVLCLIVGDSAKEISSMFLMGSSGLSVDTMLQFLTVSILITGARFFYFNDVIIKKASITTRTILMSFTIILIITAFIYRFEWFPVNMWLSWVMFFISFGTCFIISVTITYLKEKMDNRNMENALKKLKERIG